MSHPDPGPRNDLYAFAPETIAGEFPDYEIVREVGKGSMGIVFEARRRSDGQRLALKVLPPSLTLTERALARFVREGELMIKVRHPSIVAAIEHGAHGRLYYFFMEFVEGVTLEERLRVGPLAIRQAAEIGSQIGRALQAAHEHGVVHRDLKPSNLMIREDGSVAITDFGLARETGTGSLTESGSIVGTPMYMPPEQVLGDRAVVGTRADVYGLGATLYHLVTGAPPFSGSTAQAVLKDVLERDPVPPRRLRADLPRPLEAVIYKAMEKSPARRYGSAEEMAEDLERFLRGDRVQARIPGAATRVARAARARPLLTSLIAVVIVLSVGAVVLTREHRLGQLRSHVQIAERKIAQASAVQDEQRRPLSMEDRRLLLQDAIDAATMAIEQDRDHSPAWLARARAHHWLQQHQRAIADLDQAERCGGATPEILRLRIDALGQSAEPGIRGRLLTDLMTLLELEPGTYTRCLVAEQFLDLAAGTADPDRATLLARASQVLERISVVDARAAVARARLLELQGDATAAHAAMTDASATFRGDPEVHQQAAKMFHRLGYTAESQREARLAQMLDPLSWPNAEAPTPEDASPTQVDVDELGGFLKHVDDLMQALDPEAGRR